MKVFEESMFYAELTDSKDELGFTYKELYEYFDLRRKDENRLSFGSFKRMVDEGKGFSDAEKEILLEFINNKRYYHGYEHMNAERFCILFNDLFDEFAYTQEKFEEETGIDQTKVSRIKNLKKPYHLSAKEQYQILTFFLNKSQRVNHSECFDPANVYECHYDRAKELYRILGGKQWVLDSFEKSQKKHLYSDRNILDVLIDFLLTLPIAEQDMILEAPVAFFDTLLTSTWIDEWVSYDNQINVIEFYNGLSASQKESFQMSLEKMCFEAGYFTYCDGFMFDLITQKRIMIDKARKRGIPDPPDRIQYPAYTWFEKPCTDCEGTNDAKKAGYDPEKQKMRFEQNLLDFIRFEIKAYPIREGNGLIDDMIDGIVFRLKMSPFEWHLDMLNSLCRLNDLGDEVNRLISVMRSA